MKKKRQCWIKFSNMTTNQLKSSCKNIFFQKSLARFEAIEIGKETLAEAKT